MQYYFLSACNLLLILNFLFASRGKQQTSLSWSSFRHMLHVHTLYQHAHLSFCWLNCFALCPLSSGKQQSTAKRYGAHILQSHSPFKLIVLILKSLFFFVFFIAYSLLVCVSSFADTDPLCYPALFAHHIAAPVKLAVAAFAPRLLQDVVASPAAQTLTVVHAWAGLVADPALRARRVRPQVPLAEIRRLFKVDQFVDAWPPPMRVVVVVVVLMVVMVVVVVVVMVVVVVVVVGVVELSGVSVVSFDKRGDVEALFED